MRPLGVVAAPVAALVALAVLPDVGPAALMDFGTAIHVPAVSLGDDLYEPTVFAAPDGTLYLTAHSPLSFFSRSPAFASRDGGRSWSPLPGLAPATTQTAGVGEGDEASVATDGAGRAWMLDLGAGAFPVYGYCGDGASLCSYDSNAYDPLANELAGCGTWNGAGGANANLDRPWVALDPARGRLVLANNARKVDGVATTLSPTLPARATYSNVLQLGALDLATGAARWNMCADIGDDIPGPVAVRASDGFLAATILAGDGIEVVTGHDITAESLRYDRTPLPTSVSIGACNVHNWAVPAFSGAGTLYVAAASRPTSVRVAASRDDARSWAGTTLDLAPSRVGAVWLSGAPGGREGALLSFWSFAANASGASCPTPAVHLAHVRLDASGAPLIEDETIVAAAPAPCGDLQSSAVDAAGRAVVALYDRASSGSDACGRAMPGSRPLFVLVQGGGATL